MAIVIAIVAGVFLLVGYWLGNRYPWTKVAQTISDDIKKVKI